MKEKKNENSVSIDFEWGRHGHHLNALSKTCMKFRLCHWRKERTFRFPYFPSFAWFVLKNRIRFVYHVIIIIVNINHNNNQMENLYQSAICRQVNTIMIVIIRRRKKNGSGVGVDVGKACAWKGICHRTELRMKRINKYMYIYIRIFPIFWLFKYFLFLIELWNFSVVFPHSVDNINIIIKCLLSIRLSWFFIHREMIFTH